MPPLVSVIVPTHDHAELLPFALESIRRQSFEDFEILVLGDGASDTTLAVVDDLGAREPRLRWFPHEKGPRLGEVYRHRLIHEEARGALITYLTDDDLWFADHLEVVVAGLDDHDFVGTWAARLRLDQSIEGLPHDLTDRRVREAMLKNTNFLPLAGAAHTVEAYRRLPHGWRTTPVDTFTDLYMWQQWLEAPGMHMASIAWPTLLSFTNEERKRHAPEARRRELGRWADRIFSRPLTVRQAALMNMGADLVDLRFERPSLPPRSELEAARSRSAALKAEVAELKQAVAASAEYAGGLEHSVRALTDTHEHDVRHIARIEAELEASVAEAAALRARWPVRLEAKARALGRSLRARAP